MKFDDRQTLLDIAFCLRTMSDHVRGLTKEQFSADRARQDAVLYRITVLGEAARRMSEPFRASHPEVPWSSMVGMRNRVIHGYDQVDLHIVWGVVTLEVPVLFAKLQPLIPQQDK